jgi:hypothetical protein
MSIEKLQLKIRWNLEKYQNVEFKKFKSSIDLILILTSYINIKIRSIEDLNFFQSINF